MAIELLTPFTKVELKPEIKEKKHKQVGILGGILTLFTCPSCCGGPSTTTVRTRSGPAYA